MALPICAKSTNSCGLLLWWTLYLLTLNYFVRPASCTGSHSLISAVILYPVQAYMTWTTNQGPYKELNIIPHIPFSAADTLSIGGTLLDSNIANIQNSSFLYFQLSLYSVILALTFGWVVNWAMKSCTSFIPVHSPWEIHWFNKCV